MRTKRRRRPARPPAFVVVRGRLAGRILPIPLGCSLLGRGREADIRVPAREVSRRHLELSRVRDREREDVVVLRDLDSRNGTAINGERLRHATRRLQVGDRIVLGEGVELVLIAIEAQRGRARGAGSGSASSLAALTPREREVAGLLAEGLTRAKAAIVLGVGERTVATHVEHIYRKLGIHSRVELARIYEAERASSG